MGLAPPVSGGGNPLDVFGVIVSRFCTARCGHCGSSSGPEHRERISTELVEHCLDVLPTYGFEDVVLTGGEPLAFWSDTCEMMDRARQLGLGTQLCTNAFWARDPTRALEKVGELKERGLVHLMLSTDSFHVRFVPVDSVINAARAAAVHGVSCQIAVPSLRQDWTATGLLARLRHETEAFVYAHPVHPVGRGASLPSHQLPRTSLAVEGCELVGSLEVDVDGTVSTCPTSADFGDDSPLILGRIGPESLDSILDRYLATPLMWVLARYGAPGLARLFAWAGVLAQPPTPHHHVCHLCQELNASPELAMRFAVVAGVELLEPVPSGEFSGVVHRLDELMAAALSSDPLVIRGASRPSRIQAPVRTGCVSTTAPPG